MISRGLLMGPYAFPHVETHLAFFVVPAYSCMLGTAGILLGLTLQVWHARMKPVEKMDSGNGSNGIGRVTDASRSPSPDPKG